METYLVAAAVFAAVFTQSLVGFGGALIAMPLLVAVLGIQLATPLVALIALTTEVFLVLYFRRDLTLSVIWPLVVSAFIGVPLGILLLERVDERVVLALLGIVIVAYAIYGLLDLTLPELTSPIWAWIMGLIAGILGGAYNVSGPPVVIYGNCRRWSPTQFKGNLQGFFLGTTILVVVGHGFTGNVTPVVLRSYLISLAPMVLGMVAGLWLGKRIDPATFRRLVLVLLVGLGLSLIF